MIVIPWYHTVCVSVSHGLDSAVTESGVQEAICEERGRED